MSDITVRMLTEDDWQTYRAVRLQALKDSPEAFVATLANEEAEPDEFWQARMARARRLVATADGEDIGVASVGTASESRPDIAQLFGLWVAPARRGSGVATKLVEAGVEAAQADGKAHLSYWVGTENGRAVAFASGFGFRPADARRPMRVGGDNGEQEIMMILPLGHDRGMPTAH